MTSRRQQRQQGAAALEFALVVVIFTALLTGITEFGRFLYVWNTVQEVTRSAARAAVVRPFSAASVDAIQREAVFHGGESGNVSLPGGQQITSTRVQIRYLNASLGEADPLPADAYDNAAACLSSERADSCVRFVEARVCEASNRGCAPVEFETLFGVSVFVPVSTVTMPAESLGM